MRFLSSRKSIQPLCQQRAIYTLSGGAIKDMVHRNSISFPEYGRREKRAREGVFKQPGVKKNRISRIMLKVKAQSIN